MNGASLGPPSGPTVSSCLPAPRAKDLLLPAAGVAMGVFLAFGPYFRPSRSMKGVLLTVPTLASLIVLRALRPPLPIRASDQYVDTEFTLDGYLAADKTIQKQSHRLQEGQIVWITGTCSVDIPRAMWRDTYFASQEGRAYFQLHLVTKEMDKRVPDVTRECVEKLKNLGFSLEEIEKLSIVWHQGGMGDLLTWMNQEINGDPKEFSAHHIALLPKNDVPTNRLWKIYREKGDLIIDYQLLCGSYPDLAVDKAPECYVMGSRKINLTQGIDEMSYRASFDLSSLPFDIS